MTGTVTLTLRPIWVIVALVVLMLWMGLVSAPRDWDYHVAHFDREDERGMYAQLKDLSHYGWEYAGPLMNNGMNAQYVVFRRQKAYRFVRYLRGDFDCDGKPCRTFSDK